MKYLAIVLLVFLSCSGVNMGNEVIYSKTSLSPTHPNPNCRYAVRRGSYVIDFYAPCVWYGVGDSINKWYRIAQECDKE